MPAMPCHNTSYNMWKWLLCMLAMPQHKLQHVKMAAVHASLFAKTQATNVKVAATQNSSHATARGCKVDSSGA